MSSDATTGTFHGCHLIGSGWVSGTDQFASTPVTGAAHQVRVGPAADVGRAAEAAFRGFGWASRATRAPLLERIADDIEARADTIRRFLRPAAYQDFPNALLPRDLRGARPA